MSSKHVALYLLKGAGNACRVVYYVRAAPLDLVGPFIELFDEELRRTFDEDEKQWEQSSLGVRLGGMGKIRGRDIADAAYIASRAATYEDCKKLDAGHVWCRCLGGMDT